MSHHVLQHHSDDLQALTPSDGKLQVSLNSKVPASDRWYTQEHEASFIRARFVVWAALLAALASTLLFVYSFLPCVYDAVGYAPLVRSFARAVAVAPLEVFQVYPPVLTVAPDGALEITDGSSNATVELVNNSQPTCQEVLAVYSFAFSYNKPFVGHYTPPACSFNRVTWNLTVVSAGRQFDRLGIVYFGNIELFRTSTAEPTKNGGIRWVYLKASLLSLQDQGCS